MLFSDPSKPVSWVSSGHGTQVVMAADGRDAFFRGRRVRRRQLRAREAVLPAAVDPRLPDIPVDMAERASNYIGVTPPPVLIRIAFEAEPSNGAVARAERAYACPFFLPRPLTSPSTASHTTQFCQRQSIRA